MQRNKHGGLKQTARIIYLMVLHPSEAFERALARGKMLGMVSLLILAQIISGMLLFGMYKQKIAIDMLSFGGGDFSDALIAGSIALSGLNPIVYCTILAGGVFMILALMRWEGRFKDVLLVVVYSFLPSIIECFVFAAFSLVTGDIPSISPLSLGLYFQSDISPIATRLLSAVNLASVWRYVLLYVGLSRLTGKSKRSLVLLVMSLFILSAAASIVMRTISS